MSFSSALAAHNTQHNSIAHIPDALSSLTPSPIKQLPKVLLRKIQDYIVPKETASTGHLVCRSWHDLAPIDGHLDLSSSKITGHHLAQWIKNYQNGGKLTSVNLSKCRNLTNDDLSLLSQLPLTELNLSGCKKITSEGLCHLSALPLQKLDFSWTKGVIAVEDLAHVAKCGLKSLNLSGSGINDNGLALIGKTALKQLGLKSAGRVTDNGLKALSSMPLTKLDISWNKQITDKGLAFLAQLPLTELNLSLCQEITDIGIEHLKKLPLQQLDAWGCRKITHKGFEIIAKWDLTHLNLYFCSVEDKTLALLINLPLKELNLGASKVLSDEGLKHLADLSLTRLHLKSTSHITIKGLEHLKKLPLKYLNLTGSFKKDSRGRLKILFPQLEELVL